MATSTLIGHLAAFGSFSLRSERCQTWRRVLTLESVYCPGRRATND
jgi:hypothetical protein